MIERKLLCPKHTAIARHVISHFGFILLLSLLLFKLLPIPKLLKSLVVSKTNMANR